MARKLFTIAVLGAIAVEERDAFAAPRSSARLVYERQEGTEACPDEVTMRSGVAQRLGYDPFDPGATKTVRAVIRRRGGALTGTLDLVDAQGKALGHRELASKAGDCEELAATLTLGISIAIDPASALQPVEPPSPAPPPPPSAPPAASAPPSAAAPRDEPTPPPATTTTQVAWIPRVGLGALGSIGEVPAASPGLIGSVGMMRGRWSFDLEARGVFAQSEAGPGTLRASAWLATGRVVPCGHLGVAFGCGVLELGGIFGAGEGAPNTHDESGLHAAGGLRAGVEPALSDRLSLRAAVDVLVPFTRSTLQVAGIEVWTAPPVGGMLSASLVYSFCENACPRPNTSM